MQNPHIELIVDRTQVPAPLKTALTRLGARVSYRSMDKALTSGVSRTADACVILSGEGGGPDSLDRILANASDHACGTLVIPPRLRIGSTSSSPGTTSPADAGTGIAPPFPEPAGDRGFLNADELTGRIKALCELRDPLKRMREEIERLRRRDLELTSGTEHFVEQLRLASRLQQDLLPVPTQETAPLSISTLFLPADQVSGDIYDISRLDAEHLSLSLADATGHGLPAALLTMLVKSAFRGSEFVDGHYRIIEPSDLLSRLNRDMLKANLSQCQFITGLHAVFSRSTRTLRWSRGGLPYPILIRPGQAPIQMVSEGSLIGAINNPHFETVEHLCEPGDLLLFYTDGLEALLLGKHPMDPQAGILGSPWILHLAEDGPEAALAEIRAQAMDLPADAWPKDDITAVAVSMS